MSAKMSHKIFLQFYFKLSLKLALSLSNPTSGRGLFSRGGALRAPPLEINEGASGEQDSLNTIFNTHKNRIVCKIWSSYFIVHARARSF